MPARLALERGLWAEAAKLPLEPAADAYPWKKYPQAEAVNAFARGLGAAMSGDAAARRRRGHAAAGAARRGRRSVKISYWADQIDIQAEVVRGLASFAGGKGTRGWRSSGPPPTARTPPRSTSSRRARRARARGAGPGAPERGQGRRGPARLRDGARPRSRTAIAPSRAPCRRPSGRATRRRRRFRRAPARADQPRPTASGPRSPRPGKCSAGRPVRRARGRTPRRGRRL